jgi:CheY-like chemotaxis protein
MTNPTQSSRILIADHDKTFLDQLADRLLQMDMEVDFAENGRTAIQLVESESYDLIVTEIAMPIYNGLEILRKAKEHNPRTPILITSFSATTEWAEQAIREGAHSYLQRPLKNMREFDHAVKDALTHKPAPQENSFFQHVFSAGMREVPASTPTDIPMPDWELNHELTSDGSKTDSMGKRLDTQISLPEGAIELNSQGQILNCDPAARKWLMLEANTRDHPIDRYIKALGSKSAPANVETQINGYRVHLLTNRIRDRMGSERIILRIREAKGQGASFPAASFEKKPYSTQQQRPKAGSTVAFGGNLKKYDPEMVDQGWSPLMFFDQVKKTIKDEVERIKENNPLHIFEPQPEDIDPEVMMTMSRRISDVSNGRRTPY